ncbi:hypothetical protein [Clostridium chromiireducens]|uniref:Uncharacterized protein n=1 Tax=Clostridium chromiireducens TaxID=225345 RepID=A0A1V4IV44_9CLOT|nr:hypothetical protein [Clostridium chromiireducens]OPJ63690.1 hypothetical protein CLCHR_15050 [Clostridium chromiireducens]
MSSFKEILERDNAAIFNEDEYSSKHDIDGKDLTITIDSDKLKERKEKYAEGTYLGELLFYIQKDVLGYEPVINQRMRFDKEPKFVTDFQEDMGVYTIVLSENKA